MQLQAPGKLARVEGKLGKNGLIAAPGLHGGCHGLTPVLEPPESVEQFALPALVQQTLLVVLPMNLDETPRHVRQAGRRHGLVVDPGS